CGPSGEGLNLVFLFKSLRTPFRAGAFRDLVAEFELAFPEPLHPTYVFGNHDRPRQMERLGNDVARARLLATFQMTVRGVPFIYYGDELGLPHHEMPRETAQDPLANRFRFIPKLMLPALRRRGILTNRDECRSPMPWHGGKHAGFAPPDAPEPWLPLHPQSSIMNVALQREDPASVLASYRRMLRLRALSLSLCAGSLEITDPPADDNKIFAYRRHYEDADRQEIAEVFLNFSKREVSLDLRHLPRRAESRLYSNLQDTPKAAKARHVLRPWEGVVVLRNEPT
ncbi:MAG: alpha-amylase family glycosyl hydrolase, partial [Polyangiales bacterium]